MSITEWHKAAIAGKVVKALKKNGFEAVYFSNRDEATEFAP